MGVPLLWSHLGNGRRLALAKLVEEGYKDHGYFRIAIDVSIWAFQTRAAQGGANPALRTMYYRLAKLMLLGVSPVFVFDGPDRPCFKRNKKVRRFAHAPEKQTQTMIDLFGFDWVRAAGEAEAECARLQRAGVVDAIMTEDVDALMFQGDNVLRGWSSETAQNMPTHVTLYKMQAIEKTSGLTPPAMILIALMAGGDYIPAGIAKVGIKTAVQAGSAGYGEAMLEANSLEEWREEFAEALRTNNKEVFTRRHPSVAVAPDFPNREVLDFYLHPKVHASVPEGLWQNEPRPLDLRQFTADYLGWSGRRGALYFLRSFSPAYLCYKLRRSKVGPSQYEVHAQREHASTDSSVEYRLSFVPMDVIPFDLERESAEAPLQEEDALQLDPDEAVETGSPRKPRNYNFDPNAEYRVWVLGCLAELDLLGKVKEWQANRAAPKRVAKPRPLPMGGDQRGAIHKYFKSVKPRTPTKRCSPEKRLPSQSQFKSPSKSPSKTDRPVPPTPLDAIWIDPPTPTAVRMGTMDTRVPELETDLPRPLPYQRPALPPGSPSLPKPLPYARPAMLETPSKPAKNSRSDSQSPRRSIVLRESLEGAWDDASEISTKHVWTDVEVFDLTSEV